MRHPRILDVMRAVRVAARVHPEIRAFFYAPARRLRLEGDGGSNARVPELEVVVEPRDGESPDLDAIARELTDLLRPAVVAVRTHKGDGEDRSLFRLLSRDEASYAARKRGEGA